MTHEGQVHFALYGNEFDPDEVTRLVGIEPSFIRHAGTPNPRQASWKISSAKLATDVLDVYEMSSALVAGLVGRADQIVQAQRRFSLNAELEVVLWLALDESVPMPAIGFTPEVIAFLHTVGASVDVDTYRK